MPLPRIRFRPHALPAALLILLLAATGGVAAAMGGPSAPDAVAPSRPHAFPALLPDSAENTSVIAQNDGDAPSVMVMDFHTPGGVLITAASQVFTNVPAGGSRTFAHALNGGLVPGFRGAGTLSSDQPMNALLTRELTGPDGVRSYSIHTASARGGTRVILPYVANRLETAAGDVIHTRLAIANGSDRVACIGITYAFHPNRGRLGPEGRRAVTDRGVYDRTRCPSGGRPIQPNGQLTLAPTRVDAALPMPAVGRNTLAAVTIDSTAPITVAADVYRRDGRQLAAYDGFLTGTRDSATDDLATRMILPIAQKAADGFWTEYAFMNPWREATTARITYTGAADGGEPVTVTVAVEVPAGEGRGHAALDSAELPDGFRGAAVIESGLPLAAVLLRGRTTANGGEDAPFAAVNGVPADRAARTLKLPLIFRNAEGTDERDGFNSSVSIAVADGGTANLRITAANDPTAGIPGCTAPAVYMATVRVTGSIVLDQSLDDPALNGLGAAPACLRGGMTIASDRAIVAVAGVTSDLRPGDNDALYNAFR